MGCGAAGLHPSKVSPGIFVFSPIKLDRQSLVTSFSPRKHIHDRPSLFNNTKVIPQLKEVGKTITGNS